MRLLRSAGVRLAASYAGLFSASALALVLMLWWATVGLLNGQVDAAIRADAQGLAERWQDGGAAALLATIEDRLAQNVDDDAVYLVLDPEGHRVAGNLLDWPSQVTRVGPVYELEVMRRGVRSLARVHRFDLPAGYALLVGRDVAHRAALRELLTQTLGWALLLIGVLSLMGAVLVQRMFHRMLSRISVTADAISAGDLSRRVRLSGRSDEFDRLAETINDMLDRISRLMDGVRQVSNAIAHDLRTPITRARARLEDAGAHAGSLGELQGAVGRAVADLDGITAVFQALLRIAEIEAGAQRSAFTAVDTGPLLADLADLYRAVAEEAGQHLRLQAEGSLRVHGDRELIQQAIANLLDNAIKFSPAGGTILLCAAMTPAGVRILIRDEGPGVPAADLPRAADRFFRGEAARQTAGFGLGLTLVRAVAQLHGGTLGLQDAVPGLCAELLLPAMEAELPPRPRPVSLDAAGLAPAPLGEHIRDVLR